MPVGTHLSHGPVTCPCPHICPLIWPFCQAMGGHPRFRTLHRQLAELVTKGSPVVVLSIPTPPTCLLFLFSFVCILSFSPFFPCLLLLLFPLASFHRYRNQEVSYHRLLRSSPTYFFVLLFFF